MTIEQNCRKVESTVEAACLTAGRKREEVTVVAVTKTKPVEQVEELYRLGYRHFAENRPEGLIEKQTTLPQEDIYWHYIGTLQTRKVKQVINRIAYFHALDRMSLAKEINERAEKPVSCFVQVNATGESSKHGLSASEDIPFINSLEGFPNITVGGLMTMAPIDATDVELRRCFKDLKIIQEQVAALNLAHAPCTETSMGMSQDYPIAIAEGATFVRVGSAFFAEAEA